MEIEGRIIQFLGEQSGTSKAGNPWKKKEWVLETFGQYPRKVKFHIFGDRADQINLEPGRDYVLSFDLESREFNGRWYTDVSVFRAQDYNGQQSMGNPQGGFGGGYPNTPQGNGFAQVNDFPGQGQMGIGVSSDTFNQGPDSDEDLPF